MLIDTHAHLDDERFAADLAAVVERAQAAGVVQILTVATTGPTSHLSVALAARFPPLHAAVGIHPNSVSEVQPGDWDEVIRLSTAPKVVALGETGLDRYWDRTPFADQEEYFARHLELSRRSGLPLVIHCREAEADMLRMLRVDFDRHGPIHGVMHSFTGGQDMANACLNMGLYLSFAGMITYKNAADLREVAARVPEDRLLVETDSPYLAPVPVRGRRNEPANVAHTAALLAQVHGIAPDQLAERTTRNAHNLFTLLTPSP